MHATAASEASGGASSGRHAHRTPGGDPDRGQPPRPAAARRAERAGTRPADRLLQPPPADRPGHPGPRAGPPAFSVGGLVGRVPRRSEAGLWPQSAGQLAVCHPRSLGTGRSPQRRRRADRRLSARTATHGALPERAGGVLLPQPPPGRALSLQTRGQRAVAARRGPVSAHAAGRHEVGLRRQRGRRALQRRRAVQQSGADVGAGQLRGARVEAGGVDRHR